jgi:hypothetical protein
MITQEIKVKSNSYTVSAMDVIRINAGDWFEDAVIGRVDVTGEGHYDYDSINDDRELMEDIAFAIRSDRLQARYAAREVVATSRKF